MNDIIVRAQGRLLLCGDGLIEEVPDPGGFPVVGLGSEVQCGMGVRSLARKGSPEKDFKKRPGTVAVVHLEFTPDDELRVVELGVQVAESFGWFRPTQITFIDDPQEVHHAS